MKIKYNNVLTAIATVLIVACSSIQNSSMRSQSLSEGSWPDKTGVKLLNDLGGYHHAITARNPMAQSYFNQGLVMSFAFNHHEAIRAFHAAQQLDENCAMCY